MAMLVHFLDLRSWWGGTQSLGNSCSKKYSKSLKI